MLNISLNTGLCPLIIVYIHKNNQLIHFYLKLINESLDPNG